MRCTFFGELKNLCSSKFVQLDLLDKAKARTSKKTCSSRFSLHKFVHLKFFWTLLKNVHSQGPCCLRLCISMPYCIWFWKRIVFNFIMWALLAITFLSITIQGLQIFQIGISKVQPNPFMYVTNLVKLRKARGGQWPVSHWPLVSDYHHYTIELQLEWI